MSDDGVYTLHRAKSRLTGSEKSMSKIRLDKAYIETSLLRYIDVLLGLPEIKGVKIRGILIQNDSHKEANLKEALRRGYHDCYSDSDIIAVVTLPANGQMTPSEYIRHPSRFGITPDKYLGFLKTVDSGIYRIVFKDGTRYDLGFDYIYDDAFQEIVLKDEPERYSNSNWPIEKIDEFWFVMIQALGKLYRRDYLISSHLANIGINETLVQQMVNRDIEHGTTHHRYGYSEELVYQKYEGLCRFTIGDACFDIIADKLYAAVLAYDELTKGFYPDYETRSEVFFDIWQCYNDHIREV